MAIKAIGAGLKCGQYFLGPKTVSAAASGPTIVEAIRQTVGNFFWCMETNQSTWNGRSNSQPVVTIGPDHELSSDGVPPSQEKTFDLFRSGVNELEPILASILSKDTHAQIKAIALTDRAKFHLPGELWVKTLYEFAASYHHAVLNRDHLVQALVPYTAAGSIRFCRNTLILHRMRWKDSPKCCARNSSVRKPYLLERWTAKRE